MPTQWAEVEICPNTGKLIKHTVKNYIGIVLQLLGKYKIRERCRRNSRRILKQIYKKWISK